MACECERDGDTNLGQALQLVGGAVVQSKIRSDDGRVARLVEAGKTDAEILDALFLGALSRYPSQQERAVLLPRLDAAGEGRRRVAEDVLWALVNHREFLFQH
jgi:hypothetical protein